MPFCPSCRYEYKPGIWKCPDCGAQLVERLPEETPKDEPEDLSDPDFVPLRNLPSRLYAEMLREALEAEGIVSMIKGDEGIAFRTMTASIPLSNVTIWVPRKDVERAQEVANQMLDHI